MVLLYFREKIFSKYFYFLQYQYTHLVYMFLEKFSFGRLNFSMLKDLFINSIAYYFNHKCLK